MNHEELTEKEKELFAALRRETAPPAALESRIVHALKEGGLLERNEITHSRIRWAMGIAAGLILFMAGLFYGKSTTMNTINPEKGYILLLHEDEAFQPGDPMEMFHEYSDWMQRTQEGGVHITGQELTPEGMMVNKKAVTPARPDWRTTGYFIVEAGSMEEALAIARDNPHVKYGGKIEIRPFMVR